MKQSVHAQPFAPGEKQAVAHKITWTSIALNSILTVLQILVGLTAHSQALLADGIHTLADLASDFIVLLANRHSHEEPDADHNYGHSRYETVASLFLGVLLVIVGATMLWRAGIRLTELDNLPAVHISAFVVAILVLISKESLFRYMLREAHRVRSAMLIANAWHARSDAASSLVAALGIIGSVAGARWLDPIAAALVGFLVARMGWSFGWDAIQDLVDRALDEQSSHTIRTLLMATSGVRGVHELRTRKMGDLALVDAHILVDPFISVSEGHYIAETARLKVLQAPNVLDALIHVDPENDVSDNPLPELPSRTELTTAIESALIPYGTHAHAINIHYLQHGIDLEITLPANTTDTLPDWQSLQKNLGVRQITVMRLIAQNTQTSTPAPASITA
jgi:cation diffusion facilitator family transporter